MTSQLFSPFALRGLTLPNRIVVSPMCQYSAEDGSATDWHLMHLGSLALGSPGLLLLEATAVEAMGRITHGCLGLYSDANEAALARVLAALRRWTPTRVGIQLAHAGRKASSHVPWETGMLIPPGAGGWRPVAPSAVAQREGEAPPDELDAAGLARIRDAFVASTRRALRLGFDALELHCAHGYLLHEFLSPISNRRTDDYGGALENRLRFPLEVFDAVRAAWPADRPLGVRVSATDWVDGGWDPAQTLVLARALHARGCDWIDTSSGGVSPQQKIPLGPGYQVHLSRMIRQETGIATMAVGLITEPRQAEAIVAAGDADLVAVGRGVLWDPRWAWHAAAQLGGTVTAPVQYWRSPPKEAGRVFGDTPIGMR
ncbi:MAG: NADH:flavin oxidoreductase/NADH oxidase [Burkholderiales bacterium]|nr:NADH:flavin oxidoreductase/NADH oxidase [Burkholderiales bacterium]